MYQLTTITGLTKSFHSLAAAKASMPALDWDRSCQDGEVWNGYEDITAPRISLRPIAKIEDTRSEAEINEWALTVAETHIRLMKLKGGRAHRNDAMK